MAGSSQHLVGGLHPVVGVEGLALHPHRGGRGEQQQGRHHDEGPHTDRTLLGHPLHLTRSIVTSVLSVTPVAGDGSPRWGEPSGRRLRPGRMAAMTLRVIQFSTGNVGVHSLRAIIEHPDPRARRRARAPARRRSGATPPSCAGSTPRPASSPPTTSTPWWPSAPTASSTRPSAEERPARGPRRAHRVPRGRHQRGGHLAGVAGLPAGRRRLAARAVGGRLPPRRHDDVRQRASTRASRATCCRSPP